MNHKRTNIAASLAIAALPTVGCGASRGPDKAGGDATPITLHLATQDRPGLPGRQADRHFADQVRRRSGRSIRIVVTYNAAGAAAGFYQRVADTRAQRPHGSRDGADARMGRRGRAQPARSPNAIPAADGRTGQSRGRRLAGNATMLAGCGSSTSPVWR